METKNLSIPFAVKDADRGEVEAIIATLNVVDRDHDVILPGAIPEGSKVTLSDYGHSALLYGEKPVGKGTLHAVGDKVHFRGKFFLDTEGGREAFATVKALGSDGEWSFGFSVIAAENAPEAWAKRGAYRMLKQLECHEVSPVLVGAGIGTGTLTVKGASLDADARSEIGEIFEAHQAREQFKTRSELEGMVAALRARETQSRERIDMNEVPSWTESFPRWKNDAAEWGVNWVTRKVFPGMRWKGQVPTIRFFDGPPADRLHGAVHTGDLGTIWVSAKLDTWVDVIQTAAHETVHVAGYDDEVVPTLIGKLAAKAWASDPIFIHHGELPTTWIPPEVKEVPENAIVLELADLGVHINTNQRTAQYPDWRRVSIEL